MRILWVKMNGLWPATTGGRVRSLHILSQLSQRHSVTLLSTHGPDDDPRGLERALPHCQRVISIPYAAPKKGTAAFAGAVARSWLSADPVDLWKWRIGAVRDQVRHLLARDSVDVCVADFLFAIPNVPLGGSTPVALFEHNVEYMIWQRLAALERQPFRRALFELEWRKLRRREANACTRASLTIAVSEEDERRLAVLAPTARTAVIGTGVDTSYFMPAGRTEIPARLVFSGSMDWHPNEDAVLYFSDAILPRIRARLPEASLVVVGRNPSARLREAAGRAGFLVTGTVDDVRPYIDEAALSVVPLRAAGGTRLKIFEALAMAKAVVSTTVGAEGLPMTSGREFVAADEPDDFADAVVSLVNDPARRRAIGQAGRSLVEANYSWEQVAREFEGHCASIVAEHDASRDTAIGRAHLPRTGSPRHGGIGVVAREHSAAVWPHRHP
jgi:glycosyltransferase involved in cell wall biosynthesis